MSDQLYQAALAVQGKAYAPYSQFLVGAALKTTEGEIFTGCNVENAAYPCGTCAEENAIGSMISLGIKGAQSRIAEIAVLGAGEALVTPCGACRQRLREFCIQGCKIFICDLKGVRQTFTLEQLLPFSFGPDNLGEDKSLGLKEE